MWFAAGAARSIGSNTCGDDKGLKHMVIILILKIMWKKKCIRGIVSSLSPATGE
jgi:hypothetical protein